MSRVSYSLLFLCLFSLFSLFSCRKDPNIHDPYEGFPIEIGKIMVKNCATEGCHTEASYAAEGRLSLESWESLFRGSRNNAAVVPFRPEQSFLLNFINTDTLLGPVQSPMMPLNGSPLGDEAVLTIREWIQAGAPNIHGEVKFADNEQRSKVYITNQGCDLVAVMDKETNLIMRYIQVGTVDGFTESPHNVKVSPDGKYWYVVHLAGTQLEQYRTSDDSLENLWTIGAGDWNTLALSPDGRYGFAVAYSGQKVGVADFDNPGRVTQYNLPEKTHGSCVHPTLGRIYVTQQDKSALFKVDYADPFNLGSLNLDVIDLLQGTPPAFGAAQLLPHEVLFSPEGDQYAVTCSGSREVRFFDANTDALLASVWVGEDPVEMSYSAKHGFLVVTCMEDQATWAPATDKRGSVAMIDYHNHTLVKTLYTGFQPHGLAVDDGQDVVYIANRNINPSGPAPHHSSACGGRNGYLTLIDMNSLTVRDFKAEMAADPYAVAIRF